MKDLNTEILRLLDERGVMRIDELAASLYTSPSTVRRHLSIMQKNGQVERTHGGAQPARGDRAFPSFSHRFGQSNVEKRQIAAAASRLVKEGDVVFLDGSTSAFFMAETLSRFQRLTVVTNGIDTLHLLSKYEIDAYSTGGKISKENRAVLVGAHAEDAIRNIRADIAFFSAQSVTQEGDIYDCFEEENRLRNLMIKQSKRSVLLCDPTKLRSISPFRLCSLCDIDTVVTATDILNYFSCDTLPQILW